MKIAILTSGILPVPAVQGGAVEGLIDLYLDYNNRHRLHDITVYSVWHPAVEQHQALESDVNHYVFIKTSTPWAKFKKKFFQLTHPAGYYHYSIEYFLTQVVHHLRKQSYDVIVLENRPGYALQLKDVSDARLVYHLHNDFLNNEVSNYQALYDNAWRIVNVSDFITSRVRTIRRGDHKCYTVHNGIDLSRFQTATEQQEPHTGLHLFFCGRLIPEKGILPLLDAMEQLKNMHDIQLTVVGSAALGSHQTATPFLQQLNEKAARLKNVTFTGYVAQPEMVQLMREADVAVLPSLWDEPFGLTVVEAMAAGLPLITTRCGGITEICKDVAMLVDRDYIEEELVAAIKDLYYYPEKRKLMAQAALERAKQFDKDIYAQRFLEVISAAE